MKLSRWRAQSNNFAGSVVGGGGVAHGPTVQLAGVTTPLSLVHGTTGTFTATPKDVSAVATGAQPYWHSSDASVVRIDNAATGAYTVTGVAAGSATITVNFVAPAVAFAPTEYNAGTDTLIFNDDFSTYASATAMGSGSFVGTTATYLAPNPSPKYSNAAVTTTDNAVIASTRPGATAGEKMFQNKYNGSYQHAPQLRGPLATVDWPDPARTVYHEWWCQLQFSNLTQIPWTNELFRVKWFETYHNAARTMWNISDGTPDATGAAVTASSWINLGQAFASPVSVHDQQRAPYPGSVITDGLWHKYQYASRTHTQAAGTVSLEVWTCQVLVRNGAAIGSIVVGNRMLLKDNANVAVNSASYEVMTVDNSNGVYPIVTLQRRDSGAAPTDYGYDSFAGFGQATYRAVFTASQTGLLGVGDYIATTGYVAVGGFCVTATDDGTNVDGKHYVVSRNSADHENQPQIEYGGYGFARSTDGFTGFNRMWVDGVLILNQCKAAIGSATVPVTMKAVAQLPVNDTVQMINLGDNETGGPGIPVGAVKTQVPWNMNITQLKMYTRLEP